MEPEVCSREKPNRKEIPPYVGYEMTGLGNRVERSSPETLSGRAEKIFTGYKTSVRWEAELPFHL